MGGHVVRPLGAVEQSGVLRRGTAKIRHQVVTSSVGIFLDRQRRRGVPGEHRDQAVRGCRSARTNFATSAVRSVKPAPGVCTVSSDETTMVAVTVDGVVRESILVRS